MSQLKQLQEQMQSYILKGCAEINSHISSVRDMNVAERLDVYREAYYSRIVEGLVDDYSRLRKLMGEEAFVNMAHDYIDHYPSDSFSIRQVGKNLSDYLKHYEGCDPFYAEYAEFEWALNATLFVRDEQILTLEALAQISAEAWADLKLELHPSCRLMSLKYNVLDVCHALEHDEPEPEFVLLEQPQEILIWRFNNEAYFRVLSEEELMLLNAIQNQASFTECCEIILNFFSEEQAVSWVASTLQNWISEGIFSN